MAAKRMGRPVVLDGGPWLELATAVGGPARLAEMIGVSERTVRALAAGRATGEPTRRLVAQIARLHNCADPFGS